MQIAGGGGYIGRWSLSIYFQMIKYKPDRCSAENKWISNRNRTVEVGDNVELLLDL